MAKQNIQTKEVGLLWNSGFVMSRNTERSLRDTSRNSREWDFATIRPLLTNDFMVEDVNNHQNYLSSLRWKFFAININVFFFEYAPSKTGEYLWYALSETFCSDHCKKNVPMVEIITSVWLEAVRTHIFVLGHHLFFETHSFPWASLSVICAPLKTKTFTWNGREGEVNKRFRNNSK